MVLFDWLFLALAAPLAIGSAGHALLWKRDPRSALGWIGICLLVPFAGPLLYFLFGVNRIRTRAQKLERRTSRPTDDAAGKLLRGGGMGVVGTDLPTDLGELVRVSNAVSSEPLVRGNALAALENGEVAYPEMLAAIDGARRHVFLSTYLFETDPTGLRFIEALAAARERGVDVRVLLDGLGELYSRPRASRLLRQRGVHVARFLPPRLLPPAVHVNLRNHRKILDVDGEIAFTGGMNLGDRHMADTDRADRVVDTHFRITGPVVSQIERAFLEDWRFTTGDRSGPAPHPPTACGDSICRCLVDGPNEDLDKLVTVQIGAISAASHTISIVTPYFIPPREHVAALNAAALRGVEVTIFVPQTNNLPYVQWASTNHLWELLEQGVRIFRQPGPFAHTKLFVIDGYYTQIGSANIDPRSLRLNFELVVEVFDRDFATAHEALLGNLRQRSSEVTLAEVDGRSLPVRIRDSLAWLASPYL